MGLFSPAWMSKNEQKAMAAAAEAGDGRELLTVAFETPHESVCLAAVERMDDETRAAFVLGSGYAREMYGKGFLVRDGWYFTDPARAELTALAHMTEPKEIAFLAKTHPDAPLRRSAAHRLAGSADYAEIVAKSGETADALACLSAVTDNAVLVRLAQENEEIALAAVERVTDRAALLGIAEKKARPPVRYVPESARLLAKCRLGDWDELWPFLRDEKLGVAAWYSLRKLALAEGACPAYLREGLEGSTLSESLARGGKALAAKLLRDYKALLDSRRYELLKAALLTAPGQHALIAAMLRDGQCEYWLSFIHAVVPAKPLLEAIEAAPDNAYRLFCMLDRLQAPYCDEVAPLLEDPGKRRNAALYMARRKDRRAFPVLLSLLAEESDSEIMSALVEHFPCAETADALVRSILSSFDYCPKEADALNRLYHHYADAALRERMSAYPLQKYRRSHYDVGRDSCHGDTPGVTFDFLQ